MAVENRAADKTFGGRTGIRGLGIDASGLTAKSKVYAGQKYRDIREILARDKDFLKMIIKPKPAYLGETIPISGSGLASHD